MTVNLADALDVVVRRWIIVAIGLIATAGAVFHTLDTVGPDYQATSQVVLLTAGATTGTNPYVDFPLGLETTAAGLAAGVTSRDTRASLSRQGLDADYDVSIAPDAGPLMVITATGATSEAALATRDAVVALMSTNLSRMQADAGVPATLTVSVQPMVTSSTAEVLPGSRLRSLVSVAAAGLLLVLFVTLVLDRWLLRREEERQAAADPGQGSARVQPLLARPGVRVPIGRDPAGSDPGDDGRDGRDGRGGRGGRPGRSVAG